MVRQKAGDGCEDDAGQGGAQGQMHDMVGLNTLPQKTPYQQGDDHHPAADTKQPCQESGNQSHRHIHHENFQSHSVSQPFSIFPSGGGTFCFYPMEEKVPIMSRTVGGKYGFTGVQREADCSGTQCSRYSCRSRSSSCRERVRLWRASQFPAAFHSTRARS